MFVLDDLSKRYYDKSECAVFRKTKDRFGGLSNMSAGFPLRINGTRILTAEALYQCCRFPELPDLQKIIIEQKSPMSAKMKGKPYRAQTRPDWDQVRIPIMYWCLELKLAQNWSAFGELLIATGEHDIVEESGRDPFWGALVEPDGRLYGVNVLGRLLVSLREQLKETSTNKPLSLEPPEIPNFKLLGEFIGSVPI